MKRFWGVLFFVSMCFCAAAQQPAGNPYSWENRAKGAFIQLRSPEKIPDEPWTLIVHYRYQGSMEELAPRDLVLVTNSSSSSSQSSQSQSINTVTESFDFYPKNGSRSLFFNSERRGTPLSLRIESGAGNFLVTGVEVQKRAAGKLNEPLTTDLGTMLYYPRSRWRNREYEFFRLNHEPRILYIVSASHAVQSAFLRRLAFFVEKRGFAGRLARDEEIKDLRDWGAHDYRSADLARFFQKAENEKFPLNRKELLLRELLLANGIIRRTRNGIEAGEGALIGFSAEIGDDRLPAYFVHETVHGFYFIMPALRRAFKESFDRYPEAEKNFLRAAFDFREYNVLEDADLLVNETAAYLLQQLPAETPKYFNDIIGYWFRMAGGSAEASAWVKGNGAVFARQSEELQAKLFALTGLRVENFFDLLPKNRSLPMIP
ncbi:MAG: hypothetical protein LBB82_06460 [Treponema sp.]|jgi:hypothetical protein|nr:hypothetical protein [Treponema sp.]